MAKFQFHIAMDTEHEAGFEKAIAYIQALGPNGDRYHTGITANMTEVEYDFDGIPALITNPDAVRLMSKLQTTVREFEAGIRRVDVDIWSELDPQIGSQAWTDLVASRDDDFSADLW